MEKEFEIEFNVTVPRGKRESVMGYTPEQCKEVMDGVLAGTIKSDFTRDEIQYLHKNISKCYKSTTNITHDHTSYFQNNRVVPVLKDNVVGLTLTNPPLDEPTTTRTDKSAELVLDIEPIKSEGVLVFDDVKDEFEEEDGDDEALVITNVNVEYLYASDLKDDTASRAIYYSILRSFYIEKKGKLVKAVVDKLDDATKTYYNLPQSIMITGAWSKIIANGIGLSELRRMVFAMDIKDLASGFNFIEYPRSKILMKSKKVKRLCDYGDQPEAASMFSPDTKDTASLVRDIMKNAIYVTGSSKLYANTARCYITGLHLSNAYYKAYMRLMDVDVPSEVTLINVYRGGLIFCKGLMRKYPKRKFVVVNVSTGIVRTHPDFVTQGRKVVKVHRSAVITCESLESDGLTLFLDVGAPDGNNYANKKRDRLEAKEVAMKDLSDRVKAHVGQNQIFHTYVGIHHVMARIRCHPSVFAASGIAIYRTNSTGYPQLRMLTMMLTMSRYCLGYPYHLVPRLHYKYLVDSKPMSTIFEHPPVCDFRLTAAEKIQLVGGTLVDTNDGDGEPVLADDHGVSF